MENTEEVVQKRAFTLPNKKVTVVPIKRARGHIKDPNHIGYFLLPGATIEFCPRNVKGTSTIDCPLNAEEIAFFEDKSKSGMAFNLGDLSPYKTEKNFWRSKTAKVVLNDSDLKLDLSNPKDYLTYAILKSNSDKIAPSLSEVGSNPRFIYAIVDEDERLVEQVSKGDKLRKAYKLSGKMSTNLQSMVDYLTIIGKRPAKNAKREFLISEIDKQIDTNLNQFLEVLEDPDYDTRLLLAKAIQIKAVVKTVAGKYILPEGDELCKPTERASLANSIKFLDDPANQDIRLQLEALVTKAQL